MKNLKKILVLSVLLAIATTGNASVKGGLMDSDLAHDKTKAAAYQLAEERYQNFLNHTCYRVKRAVKEGFFGTCVTVPADLNWLQVTRLKNYFVERGYTIDVTVSQICVNW